MRAWRADAEACLLGAVLLLCGPLSCLQARASSVNWQGAAAPAPVINTNEAGFDGNSLNKMTGHGIGGLTHDKWGATRSYGISCVPYARQASGIRVVGNAWQWWGNASGVYARGDRPEPGSVLAFRSNSRMRLGHVAVVRQLVNAREVVVDQANWPSNGMRGGVSRNVTVVDVSEANNWSAVRVQLSNTEAFGSVYPTYGFIYNRPDNGVVSASIGRPAPQPAINRVPSDLRPVAERPWRTIEEVAESAAGPPRRIDLRVSPVAAVR